MISQVDDCLFVGDRFIVNSEFLFCKCILYREAPVSGEARVTVGQIERKGHAVITRLGVKKSLIEHLIRVKVIILLIYRQMELFAVDHKRGAADPVGVRTHGRAEAAGVLQIMFYIIVSENDVFHLTVSVRRLKTYQYSAEIRHSRAQTASADRIEENFLPVRESAKIFPYYTHPQTSLIYAQY